MFTFFTSYRVNSSILIWPTITFVILEQLKVQGILVGGRCVQNKSVFRLYGLKNVYGMQGRA